MKELCSCLLGVENWRGQGNTPLLTQSEKTRGAEYFSSSGRGSRNKPRGVLFEFGAMNSASSERNFSVAASDVCITAGRPRTPGSVALYLSNMHGPSRKDENLALERWNVCQPTFFEQGPSATQCGIGSSCLRQGMRRQSRQVPWTLPNIVVVGRMWDCRRWRLRSTEVSPAETRSC